MQQPLQTVIANTATIVATVQIDIAVVKLSKYMMFLFQLMSLVFIIGHLYLHNVPKHIRGLSDGL